MESRCLGNVDRPEAVVFEREGKGKSYRRRTSRALSGQLSSFDASFEIDRARADTYFAFFVFLSLRFGLINPRPSTFKSTSMYLGRSVVTFFSILVMGLGELTLKNGMEKKF